RCAGAARDLPADFARPDLPPPTIATGQPYALGGAVILYTAQSPAFLNGINNAAAVTADRPSVSLPLGISLNNGFGRPWFANGAGARGGGGRRDAGATPGVSHP